MSADYWVSSQRAHWQFTKEQLNTSRFNILMWEKQKIGNSNLLMRYDTNMRIFIHQMIARLGRRMSLRQVILSTAEVYISRFLTRVSLLEINIYMLVATSVYISCKICESPQHIRTILAEARNCWPEFITGDFTKLAEFEFYLIEELECYMIIHHPYNSLVQLVEVLGRANGDASKNNIIDNIDNIIDGIDTQGKNDDRNVKYRLNLTDSEIESVWQVINDSYMTDLPLLYPPHIISIAALHVVLVLSLETNDIVSEIDAGKKNAKGTTPTANNGDPLLSFILDTNSKNNIIGASGHNDDMNGRSNSDPMKPMNTTANRNTNNKVPNANTKNPGATNSAIANTKNRNMSFNTSSQGGLRRKLSQSLNHQNRVRAGSNTLAMSMSPEKSGFFNTSMMMKNSSQSCRNNVRIEEFTNFLAGSNVNLVEVIESVQELLNLYEAWQLYDEGSVRQNVKSVLMHLHTRSGAMGGMSMGGIGLGLSSGSTLSKTSV